MLAAQWSANKIFLSYCITIFSTEIVAWGLNEPLFGRRNFPLALPVSGTFAFRCSEQNVEMDNRAEYECIIRMLAGDTLSRSMNKNPSRRSKEISGGKIFQFTTALWFLFTHLFHSQPKSCSIRWIFDSCNFKYWLSRRNVGYGKLFISESAQKYDAKKSCGIRTRGK